MPITLTLVTPDGQPAQVLTVPTNWADVTLAQFVALFAPVPDDLRTMAELLLGLEAGALDQLAADDVPLIANLLAFATDPEPVTTLLPTPGLPDVGALPWGCLMLVQQKLAGLDGRGELAALPYILAVYRCQLLHGNTDRVAEVEAALLAAPVTESYADGAAFLGRCKQSLSGTSPTPATKQSPKTRNSMPTRTRAFLKGLGLPLRWTRSPAAT